LIIVSFYLNFEIKGQKENDMETVTTCFKLTFTPEQYAEAVDYIKDMKRHPKRVFWIGKERQTDEELIHSVIAHRILSGFYNINNARYGHAQVLGMTNLRNDN
jgi:hypothetical protein